jgi:hypothetical protein
MAAGWPTGLRRADQRTAGRSHRRHGLTAKSMVECARDGKPGAHVQRKRSALCCAQGTPSQGLRRSQAILAGMTTTRPAVSWSAELTPVAPRCGVGYAFRLLA